MQTIYVCVCVRVFFSDRSSSSLLYLNDNNNKKKKNGNNDDNNNCYCHYNYLVGLATPFITEHGDEREMASFFI